MIFKTMETRSSLYPLTIPWCVLTAYAATLPCPLTEHLVVVASITEPSEPASEMMILWPDCKGIESNSVAPPWLLRRSVEEVE